MFVTYKFIVVRKKENHTDSYLGSKLNETIKGNVQFKWYAVLKPKGLCFPYSL